MTKTYGQVIRETIDENMAKDKSIILIGEDIGFYGGGFGITKGLYEKYGPERVIDTPMSEQGFTGLGIGAAMNGLKPIVEIMFMDFMTLAYDQLMNHASVFSYQTNGSIKVPLVIRTPAGGGRGYGATHSKTLIGPLMHIPGIKILCPSSARNARGLLNAAIQDPDPVIFVEHKLLYSKKEELEIPDLIPIGKAAIARKGKDALVITFGKSVDDSIAVADILEKEGVSVEIIDLLTIKPLDMELIGSSVERIGKVLIVEEGYSVCGVASEIIARINETSFYSLKAPIRRVCTLDIPIPCAIKAEAQMLPSAERIEKELRGLLNE